MANRDRFKPNSAILKLAFYLILALLTSAPSCGSSIRKFSPRSTNKVAKTIIVKFKNLRKVRPINPNRLKSIYGDDVARAIEKTSFDNIRKLKNDVLIIKENKQFNTLTDEVDDLTTFPNKTVVIKNTNSIKTRPNGDIVLISSNYNVVIGNPDEIGLQKEYLEAFLKGDVLLVFPKSISLKDLKNTIQQVSDRAAQKAVKQAWSEDVSRESLKALANQANEDTKKAIFQELLKWTGSGTIVVGSRAELDAIVNQSVEKALQESITEDNQKDK